MAPLAAEKPIPVYEGKNSTDGVKAVLLGPPGSGKGTMVYFLIITCFITYNYFGMI